MPRQEGTLVGHQVVEVHRTLNVNWASILPGRRFRLMGFEPRLPSAVNSETSDLRTS